MDLMNSRAQSFNESPLGKLLNESLESNSETGIPVPDSETKILCFIQFITIYT